MTKQWAARIWIGLVAGLSGGPAPSLAQAPAATSTPSEARTSGLPIPRFVSLKSDRVNLRTGPGTDYPTSWVFRRAGLPVEVVSEFETWRQVRDSEGTTGWVVQSLLSGRRTAIVLPPVDKDAKAPAKPQDIALRKSDSTNSRAVATVEPGVITNILNCDGRWCEVTVESYRGYIMQKQLWGTYEGEKIK